jgi:hypothetical protein|tara:strand:+ start:793 stop:1476 length:684 start_codon:yes stop_codon:yes gene_type:complete
MLFPLTCSDNFFSNPDEVLTRLLKIPFNYNVETQYYPGLRTKNLVYEDEQFSKWVVKKIFSINFPGFENELNAKVDIFFQKIPPGVEHDGWVHTDAFAKQTAIIYLSKDNSAGTSIYLKNNFTDTIGEKLLTEDKNNLKYKYFTHPEKFNKEDLKILKNQKEENNSYFNETINIKSVYNRLVTFDGNSFHSAHVSSDKERLILILFFHQFLFKKTGMSYPLEGKDKV